jgi:hypothetical protein
MMTTVLLVAACVLLAVSLYYNYRLARIIFKFEDAIEESLDDLDTRYRTMSEILQRPVFFDSIEVRQVIAEIGQSRDTILKIANRFSSSDRSK